MNDNVQPFPAGPEFFRRHLLVSVIKATNHAYIDYEEDEKCREMVELIMATILTSNPGMLEHFSEKMRKAKKKKATQRKKGFLQQINRGACAYMDSLHAALTVADVYIERGYRISCDDVLNNKDCVSRAANDAYIVAQQRSSIRGWIWFLAG